MKREASSEAQSRRDRVAEFWGMRDDESRLFRTGESGSGQFCDDFREESAAC